MRFHRVIIGSLAATIAAVGITVGVVGNPPPPPPPPSSGLAQIWINPGSGGANPIRCTTPCSYDPTKAYDTMQGGYAAAQAGDTIRVRAGRFTAQQDMEYINKGSTTPINFLTDNGTVWFDNNLAMGDCTNADTRVTGRKWTSPTYVTFDGGANKDFRIGDRNHTSQLSQCMGSHITYTNMKFGYIMPMPANKDIQMYTTDHITFNYSTIGPGCCGTCITCNGSTSTPWGIVSSLKGTGPNLDSGIIQDSNLTFDHMTWYGNARDVEMWNIQYNSPSSLLQFGPSPEGDCLDGNACHGDCLHLWGESDFTLTNSILLYCDVQSLYMELQAGGYWSGTSNINNNYWTMMNEGSGAPPGCISGCGNWGGIGSHTVWTATGSSASVGPNTGTINLLGNTFGDQSGQDWGSSNGTPTWGSQTINVKGNLGSRIINDPPYTGCASAPTLTINYSHNIFQTAVSPAHSDCGSPVSDYSWSTISTWIDPLTGSLTGPGSPPNGYVTDSSVCSALGRSTPCVAGVVGPIGAG